MGHLEYSITSLYGDVATLGLYFKRVLFLNPMAQFVCSRICQAHFENDYFFLNVLSSSNLEFGIFLEPVPKRDTCDHTCKSFQDFIIEILLLFLKLVFQIRER